MRRLSLTTAATAAAVAASLALAPVAGAQTASLELLALVNGEVGTADCGLVETALTNLDLVDEDTTRAELVSNINAYIGDDVMLKFVASTSVNAIADRALECEIVQEDPKEDALSALLNSSAGGNVGVEAFLPVLVEMSSAK
ncbi:hypothetical protein [Corynebacterium guangdongense]|uniref:Uncharacterized protein YuzB (UPF0349 family) n=1 Tax=Corynebacterium guangdongense TaxID=1783348 RepID=A0ABU1ZYE7_9CORY|nr:hypothetical protein [Corynebacterium guangdongense]MDR7328908.1 uncharacterized protein YuzB (UPF0349 family) [Corynebacterium guangdongense]